MTSDEDAPDLVTLAHGETSDTNKVLSEELIQVVESARTEGLVNRRSEA